MTSALERPTLITDSRAGDTYVANGSHYPGSASADGQPVHLNLRSQI